MVKLPLESIDAMVVAPYLKTKLPPDSIIVKLAVDNTVAYAAVVAVAALPDVF